MAILSDGTLWTWGSNSNGQLGINLAGIPPNDFRNSPVQLGISSWTTISAGYIHAMAITFNGRLFAWGNNSDGRLGLNNILQRSSPVQIGSSSWTTVAAGASHNAAIRSDGLLFTWGLNTAGQLGNNAAPIPPNDRRSSPIQIGSDTWSAVSAIADYTAAIRSDGLLFAWGNNSVGQLGDNTVIAKSSPTVIGSSTWTKISAGGEATPSVTGTVKGIGTNNILYGWGYNGAGDIGDGTQTTFTGRSSPIQIGSNEPTNFSSPTQVGVLQAWTNIEAAASSSLGLRKV
jgi:alpha-tubulin suppressor-like RCC1 family protein